MKIFRRFALLITALALGSSSVPAVISASAQTLTPLATNSVWELNTPVNSSRDFIPIIRQHPISGETIVMWRDMTAPHTLKVAVLKTDRTLGPAFTARRTDASGNVGLGNHDITPGPSNEWLWTWFNDGTNGTQRFFTILKTTDSTVSSKTVDASPTAIENPFSSNVYSGALAASWNATVNRYLIALPIIAADSSEDVRLWAVQVDADGAPSQGLAVSSDPDQVDGWPWGVDVAPTNSGWIIAWEGKNKVWSATVDSASFQVDKSPSEFATTTSGTAIHPSLAVIPNGYVSVFRHSGGQSDPYSIIARWFDLTGTPIGSDVIIWSSDDSISAPRIATSGADLMVTWTGKHGYFSNDARVFTANVSLDGSVIGEPVATHSTEFAQLRPSITWNNSVSQYQVVWVQKDADDKWNLWTSFVSGPLTPELVVPEPEPEVAPSTTVANAPSTTVGTKVKKQDTLPETGNSSSTPLLLGSLLLAGGLAISLRRRIMS
jgi:LPXTG-motif cell wall-anchored protein